MMTSPRLSSSFFLFCFCAPRENDNELVFIVDFFCFLFVHLEKMMMNRLIVIFFCFLYVHPKKMTTRWHLSLFFKFSFYAPKEDNDKLALIVVFFSFVSVHLKKTMTSQCSSSSLFLWFLCTQRR